MSSSSEQVTTGLPAQSTLDQAKMAVLGAHDRWRTKLIPNFYKKVAYTHLAFWGISTLVLGLPIFLVLNHAQSIADIHGLIYEAFGAFNPLFITFLIMVIVWIIGSAAIDKIASYFRPGEPPIEHLFGSNVATLVHKSVVGDPNIIRLQVEQQPGSMQYHPGYQGNPNMPYGGLQPQSQQLHNQG
jgi:hypothetical protein